MRRQARLQALTATVVSLGAIILIAASDMLLTRAEVAFFYLAPILFAAWFVSGRTGFVFSFLAVIIELSNSVLGGNATPGATSPLVDALARLMLYCFSTWLVTTIKGSLDRERALARTDALTDVMNARMFRELGSFEIRKARRFKRPLAVAFLDIDDFKQVNDQYGHDAGDALLQTVARTLQDNLRAADIVARLGGDEFAVILPETEPAAAPQVLEKLRGELLAAAQNGGWPVTFSIGLMSFGDAPPSIEEMLRQTDVVMYEVKHSGKNKLKHVLWSGGAAPAAGTDEMPKTRQPIAATGGGRQHARQTIAALRGGAARPVGIRSWAPAVALLLMCLIGTAVFLDAVVGSLPGSSLYALKRQSENVQLLFAQDLVSLVRFHLTMADRRLGETAELLNAAQYDLSEATSREYEREIETTLDSIDTAPMDVSLDLLQTVAEHLSAQQGQLTLLAGQGPAQARAIVEHSRAKSREVSDRLTVTAARVVIARLNLRTPTLEGQGVPTPASSATTLTVTPTRQDVASSGTDAPAATAAPAATLNALLTPATPLPAGNETSTPTAAATATTVRSVAAVPAQAAGDTTGTPTPTDVVPTSTMTPIAVSVATKTATAKPNDTEQPAPSPTATPANTRVPTASPTATPTNTDAPTATASATASASATVTATPSRTPTPTRTSIPTRTPTPTRTVEPTRTPRPCDQQQKVPNLVGMSLPNAVQAWRAAGFTGDFKAWDGQPRNLVTRQDPAAGTVRSVCSDMRVDDD